MAVLVLEAGVGALARLYEEQVGPELKMNLNRTFLETYSVRSRETAAIDQMQKEVSTSSCIRQEFLLSVSSSRPVYTRARSCLKSHPRRTIANKIGRAPRPVFRYRAHQCALSSPLSHSLQVSISSSLSFLFPLHLCTLRILLSPIPQVTFSRTASMVLHVAVRCQKYAI